MTYFWFIGAVIFVLLVSIAPFLPWQRLTHQTKRAHTRALQQQQQQQQLTPTISSESAPNIVREIYIDPDGFSLIGENWRWTRNYPTDYGCPECGQRVYVTLRQYYESGSEDTYSIFRHKCVSTLKTAPIPVVQKGDANV